MIDPNSHIQSSKQVRHSNTALTMLGGAVVGGLSGEALHHIVPYDMDKFYRNIQKVANVKKSDARIVAEMLKERRGNQWAGMGILIGSGIALAYSLIKNFKNKKINH